MSDLRSVDKYKFEKLFGMSKGYLLDFSNNSFADFVIGSIGVDPYNEKYDYGDSKANKLRGIIGEESNKNVGQLLLDLLDYWYMLDEFSESDREIYSECYKICEKLIKSDNTILISPDTISKLDHDFIIEQIQKCRDKVEINDFNGAITNARSFLEAVIIELIEEESGEEVKNDGNVKKLFIRAKNILNLENRADYPFAVTQILESIDNLINGLASLSNNIGDRHANKFKTQKHHAKLAINSSMTIADFLIDSRDYQKSKIGNS